MDDLDSIEVIKVIHIYIPTYQYNYNKQLCNPRYDPSKLAGQESTTNSGALKRIRSISNYLVNMLHRRSFYHSFGSFNMKDSSNSASNSAGKMETIQEEKAANSLNSSVPNPMPDTVIPIQSDSFPSEMNKAKSQFASLLRSHTLTDTNIMNATYVCTIYIIKNKSVQNYQEQYEAMFFGDTVYFYYHIHKVRISYSDIYQISILLLMWNP